MSLASQSVSHSPRAAKDASGTLAQLLGAGRPIVMGVLNVTPDSFSDGGRFLDPDAAIEHARRMVAEGADIIDIGAESTRPYGTATPVSPSEEVRRLAPVLAAVAGLGVPVSIDTMKAQVAASALAAGAGIVNDVWGLQRDPDMARVVAEHAVPVIIMHNRETADPAIEIMPDITGFFRRSLAIAERAGIAADRIVLAASASARRRSKVSRLWPGSISSRHSACRSWSAPRANDSSTKSHRRPPTAGSAARSPRTSLRSRAAPASYAPMMCAASVQAFKVAAAIRDAR